MATDEQRARLEYLRGELRAERISWGELAELQGLAPHIDPGDVELLEAAGVPEHEQEDAMATNLKLYIDTYGHNQSIWREAGEQARIAAHTDRGVMEFVVGADGSWAVSEGPPLNEAGGYRQVARGTHGEHPSVTHYPDGS